MTDVALIVLMKDVFIGSVLNNVELLSEFNLSKSLLLFILFHFFILLHILAMLLFISQPGEALLAYVIVSSDLGLIVLMACVDVVLAFITVDDVLPIDIVLTQLVTKGEPTLPEVVVPGKQLYLLGTWHQ
jgi:hypothetical protein